MKASFLLYIDNDTKDIQYWYGVFVVFVQTKHDTKGIHEWYSAFVQSSSK